MARISDAILDQKAFGRGSTNPMLDVTYGGQQGYAPNLSEVISNQAYVRRPVVAILLEAPRFFSVMPEPEKWVSSLRSLVEVHARTIDGLNAELTVETDSHPIGGGGEIQEEITDVKRAASTPNFGFVEKYGRPIQTFISNWIRYGMMDPDTKYALAGTLDKKPEDMLLDWYSMSCLFFEPDPTHTKVVQSWVCTNMFPKGTGEIIGKRDLTAASEILNLTIPFSAVSQYNLGGNVFAQKILDNINLKNANPFNKTSFIQNIDSDVAKASAGYEKNVEDIGSHTVPGLV